jgi:hypothetical protein
MGRRCLRPAHDVQRHRLMRVAAEAADLKIEISSVQGVAEAGRGLSRSFESEHALVPGDTRQPVSFLPSLSRALRRMPDRTSVNALARLSAHLARMRQPGFNRQAATAGLGTVDNRCRSWMWISRPRMTRRSVSNVWKPCERSINRANNLENCVRQIRPGAREMLHE